MQTIALSETALAVLRFRAKKWRLLTDLHRRFDAKHGVTDSWLQFPVFSVRSWRNPWD